MQVLEPNWHVLGHKLRALSSPRELCGSHAAGIAPRTLAVATLGRMVLLPLLHGADFQVYLCVAVFQHIEADVLARCHSGDLLPFLLGYPIRGFKPAMVLPFLVRLCERHRERVMRSLRI
mgnify:CR=1 FL=1